MCGPPRSSLSSKSLAASICITYASGATVCYTIGIHLVGLMTGTKGDDAMRRRDHLRYASLFSLSPFFSPFAFVYRPKYAFILKRYLVSRLDEISVTGTSNRNDSNSFGVFFFFFQNRAGQVVERRLKSGPVCRGKLDSGRFPSLEISNSAQRHGSRPSISRIDFGRYPKRSPTRRASDPMEKKLAEKRPSSSSIGLIRSHARYRVEPAAKLINHRYYIRRVKNRVYRHARSKLSVFSRAKF